MRCGRMWSAFRSVLQLVHVLAICPSMQSAVLHSGFSQVSILVVRFHGLGQHVVAGNMERLVDHHTKCLETVMQRAKEERGVLLYFAEDTVQVKSLHFLACLWAACPMDPVGGGSNPIKADWVPCSASSAQCHIFSLTCLFVKVSSVQPGEGRGGWVAIKAD